MMRTVPPAPEVPRPGNNKDTKRWCKGVVGREHHGKWVEWLHIGVTTGTRKVLYERLKCTVCGKHLKLRATKVPPAATQTKARA